MSDKRIPSSNEIAADIKLARYSLSPEGNPNNDEALLNSAAYLTQQAIEKYLKFYLGDVYGEDENEKRFRIHNISTLSTRLTDYGFSVPKEIIDHADIITKWEAESRYGHSLITERKQIQEILDFAEQLLPEVRAKERELDVCLSKDNVSNNNRSEGEPVPSEDEKLARRIAIGFEPEPSKTNTDSENQILDNIALKSDNMKLSLLHRRLATTE